MMSNVTGYRPIDTKLIARINDVAHFHREYKRLVGFPPIRDIERLRNAASEHNGYAHVEDQPDGAVHIAAILRLHHRF